MTRPTNGRTGTQTNLRSAGLASAAIAGAALVAASPTLAWGQASPQDLAQEFVAVDGFRPLDRGEIESEIAERYPLPEEGHPSAFLGTGVGPLAKAVLAVEANDGVLPRVRYRIQYGMEWFESPGAPDGFANSYFITIDRFNLGPRVHEELVRSIGAEHVAPAETFGVGPHVSYRIAMSPVRHVRAAIDGIVRREIDDRAAAEMSCLGTGCLDVYLDADSLAEWEGMEEIPFAIDPDYEALRNTAPTPAAVLDLLAIEHGIARLDNGSVDWRGGEPRESVGPTEPFMTIIADVNLGQDSGVDLVMLDDHQMDDSVSAVWRRIATVGMGPGDGPMIFADRAFDYHRPSDRPGASTGHGGAGVVDAGAPTGGQGEHFPPLEIGAIADCAKATTTSPGAFIAFPSMEGPNWLEAGPGPVTVEFVGCSNTHEGNLNYAAYHGDNSEPTLTGFTSGGAMGNWQRFSVQETFWTAGEWTFVVFEQDMATGDDIEYDRVTFTVD